MPIARYITSFSVSGYGRPTVPGGVYADRTPGYGWRIVSYVPAGTCIVELITTQAVIDATDADDNYTRVYDIEQDAWNGAIAGGEGGPILYVTNLNNDGAGSLRAALETPGPRLVAFDVHGTIALTNDFTYKSRIRPEPYCTILGDTAPGGGVCLKGMLHMVETHDVIVQHLRIRPGADVYGPGSHNGVVINNNAYNIVIDHCSLSWGVDGNVTIWGEATPGDVRNVTLQWCILSEALHDSVHPDGPHSCNLLVKNGWRDIAIHHCLLAHAVDRNPQVGGNVGTSARVQFANNIIFDVQETAWFWGSLLMNIEGNYYKRRSDPYYAHDWEFSANAEGAVATSLLYWAGNMAEAGGELVDVVVRYAPSTPQYALANERIAGMPVIDITSAAQAYTDVLAGAGATLPARDAVDARVVANVENGDESIIDDPAEVGGWPEL